jgi:uncharacterized membrane protein
MRAVTAQLACLGLLAVAAPVRSEEASSAPRVASNVDYDRDVKPVLAARCYACHGPLKQEQS